MNIPVEDEHTAGRVDDEHTARRDHAAEQMVVKGQCVHRGVGELIKTGREPDLRTSRMSWVVRNNCARVAYIFLDNL